MAVVKLGEAGPNAAGDFDMGIELVRLCDEELVPPIGTPLSSDDLAEANDCSAPLSKFVVNDPNPSTVERVGGGLDGGLDGRLDTTEGWGRLIVRFGNMNASELECTS
jgi:hypothetical protein